MSRIRADQLVNRVGSGGPKFPNGVADGFSVSGIVTATGFSGPVTGNLTGNVTGAVTGPLTGDVTGNLTGTATTATALSGTPNITVGTVTGTDATFSGNLTVNGTTTTIDTAVTAVDSLSVDGNITGGGNLNLGDNAYLHIGASNDLELFHNAYDSYIDNNIGDLRIRNVESGSNNVYLQSRLDTIFVTGGTERLRIDSAGEIATGTIPLTHSLAKNIYISDSGDDTTGNGTSSAPWRTMSKALGQVPKFLVHNCQIIIMGSSFTDGSGNNTLKGIAGPGGVFITSQSGVVTYNKTKQFVVYDCWAWVRFQNIAFVCPVGGTGFALERNHYIDFQSGCTYEFQGQGGWSWQAGVYATNNDRIIVSCNTTCTSSSTSGLGGVWYFDNCKRVSFNGDLIKNGTQFANHGIAATNGTWIYLTGDITNFVRGFVLGANHYGNETRADAVVQNSTFTDCGTGIYLYNGSLLRNYSSSFSNTTTNINSTSGFVY